MDSRTAVFYVNQMGGTHSSMLNNLAIQLCQWYLERNLSLSAEHLPEIYNCVGDRTIQSTAEWQLHQGTFQQIIQACGKCNVDLFATCLNIQLEKFVSWRPDQEAIGSDALQLPWTDWMVYAFLPFCLIEWLERKTDKYTSSEIQNEIIKVMGRKI